jgi:hypothetical protein
MQKNVAAVAFFFCVCHIPAIIKFGVMAFKPIHFNLIQSISASTEIAAFFYVFNFMFNIFIYLAFGNTFRRYFLELFIKCRGKAVEMNIVQSVDFSSISRL